MFAKGVVFKRSIRDRNPSDGKAVPHNGAVVWVEGGGCFREELEEKRGAANKRQRNSGMPYLFEPVLQEEWEHWEGSIVFSKAVRFAGDWEGWSE